MSLFFTIQTGSYLKTAQAQWAVVEVARLDLIYAIEKWLEETKWLELQLQA